MENKKCIVICNFVFFKVFWMKIGAHDLNSSTFYWRWEQIHSRFLNLLDFRKSTNLDLKVNFFLILQEWVLTNTFKRNMVVKPQSTEWQWLPLWLPNRPKEWPNMDMVESLRNSRKNQNTILIVAVRHLLAVVVIQINHAYILIEKKVWIFMNKHWKRHLNDKYCLLQGCRKQGGRRHIVTKWFPAVFYPGQTFCTRV